MGTPLRSRAVSVAALATAVAACNALTGIGDLVTDGPPDASETASPSPTGTAPEPGRDAQVETGVDGGGLGDVDATVVDGCSTTSCEVLPANFKLVTIGPRTEACAEGFGEPFDAVENPTLAAGACRCTCSLGSQPTCRLTSGTITLMYGPPGGGVCQSAGQAVPAGCSQEGFHGPFIAFDRQYSAPEASLSGGQCSASATKDDSKLGSTPLRICQATVVPQCEAKTCPPANACIAASGDVACPAGWPTKRLTGTSASFTCGAGCTCTVAGTCGTTGTLSYYASANCTGAAGITYPVGGCQQTPGSNTAFTSHRYDPAAPSNARCEENGSSAPSAPALAQETTVCCR